MVRKVITLVMLLIFLTGSNGFSLTYHFCSHSGSSYIANFGTAAHDCSKEKKEPVPGIDCCHSEERVEIPHNESSCCTTPDPGHIEDHTKDHSCCSDTTTVLKIKTAVKSADTKVPVELVHAFITVFSLTFNFESERLTLTSSASDPPPVQEDLGILHSVFRI